MAFIAVGFHIKRFFPVVAYSAGFPFLHLRHECSLMFRFGNVDGIMAVSAFEADTSDVAIMAEGDIARFFHLKGYITASDPGGTSNKRRIGRY